MDPAAAAPGLRATEHRDSEPNPCIYTPSPGAAALYDVQSGLVVGPDGVVYSVENSRSTGDNGWKDVLAPAH